MKFSVTIPAYKSKYLFDAISSILHQTYQNYEIIIVDDCSPEDLKTVVDKFADSRIHYYRNEQNCGAINVVYNWNICLSHAHGDYVICMGDDDMLLPNCLEDLSYLIEKYPKLNVFHIQTQIIDESGNLYKSLDIRPEYETAIEMLLCRFRGRSQYIGDFCYNVNALKNAGGFFYLPLAWTSDDITAFRAALPKGIANTKQVGFKYRENRLSISEQTTNDRIKIEALRSSEKWYRAKLSRLDLGCYGSIPKGIVENALVSHYRSMYIRHIIGDIRCHPVRFFYWFFHCREVHVPRLLFIKNIVKIITPSGIHN